MDTTDVLAELKRDEGFRAKPYTDTRGRLTIGYGRNLTDVGINQDEAEYLLRGDVAAAVSGLTTRLPWFPRLDPMRQRVLCNLAVNLGVQGIMGFPLMLRALEAGDYTTAARELLDSAWATQVGARATRLATMLRTGVPVG